MKKGGKWYSRGKTKGAAVVEAEEGTTTGPGEMERGVLVVVVVGVGLRWLVAPWKGEDVVVVNGDAEAAIFSSSFGWLVGKKRLSLDVGLPCRLQVHVNMAGFFRSFTDLRYALYSRDGASFMTTPPNFIQVALYFSLTYTETNTYTS